MLGFNKWKKTVEFYQGPAHENANPYDFDETEHVRAARIKGPWHRGMPAYLERNGVKGLGFSCSEGFSCENFDFLTDLDFLELFSVPDHHAEFDPGPLPIACLSGLRRIVTPRRVAHPIDLAELTKLQSCTMKWQKPVDSVFDARQLKRLQISSLNWQKTDGLAKLGLLENLEISHSGIRSFAPIGELKNLTRLSLEVCHSLESLDGIEALQNLRCLHLVEVHKLTSLENLASLKNLEVLTVADGRDIASVAPLEGLKNLKALWIAGTKSKIIDGDLTPLTRLPKLAMLTLGNKRHYSHRAVKRWSWENFDKPDTQLEPV